jgi:tRNA(Ile)-lysidine synthase
MELVDNIESSFYHLLSNHNAEHYYLAVSGGCDSMVMLSLFKKQKRPFTVLHVNYHLRGEESDGDEAFVRQFCEDNSIPFYVLSHKLSSDLKDGGNLQNLARKVRYDFFKSYLSKHESAILCLAHHQDDQEEGFWMAMARGGGLRAISGMNTFKKPFLRPFLKHRKIEILNYARVQNIKWREDLSNQSNKYTRNIWRNVLLPELKAKFTHISSSVELLQKHFDEQANHDRKASRLLIPSIFQDFEITREELIRLNSNQWIEFLDQMNIRKNLALPIIELLNGENGKKIFLDSNDNNYRAVWKRENSLYFEIKAQTSSPPPVFTTRIIDSLPGKFSKRELYLDPNKIKGNLSVRRWQNGDRMCPIGLKGSKLVADILKDDKAHASDKSTHWVLVDEEKIISLIGYRIDQRAIANEAPCLRLLFE